MAHEMSVRPDFLEEAIQEVDPNRAAVELWLTAPRGSGQPACSWNAVMENSRRGLVSGGGHVRVRPSRHWQV